MHEDFKSRNKEMWAVVEPGGDMDSADAACVEALKALNKARQVNEKAALSRDTAEALLPRLAAFSRALADAKRLGEAHEAAKAKLTNSAVGSAGGIDTHGEASAEGALQTISEQLSDADRAVATARATLDKIKKATRSAADLQLTVRLRHAGWGGGELARPP